MMAKPMKTLELHYPTIQFLIILNIHYINVNYLQYITLRKLLTICYIQWSYLQYLLGRGFNKQLEFRWPLRVFLNFVIFSHVIMFYCSMSRTISTFVSKTFIDGSILFNLLLLNIKFCQSIMWFKMILSLLSLNSLNKMNIIVRVCKNVLLSKPRSWRSKSLPKGFCPPTVKSRFLMDSTSF